MNTRKTTQKELREFQYFYNLEDSLLFDKLLISHYPDLRNVREEIWKGISCRFKKNKSQKKEALGIILCNLKEGLLNLQPIAVSRNRNDYYKEGRCRKLHLRYHDMIPVMNILEKQGWIHSAIGMFDKDGSSKNRISRIWASKILAYKLLRNLNGTIKVPKRKEEEELIVLKSRNKKNKLNFDETDFTENLRQSFDEYHVFMKNVKISSHISITHPSILKAIHRINPFLPSQFTHIPADIEDYTEYIRELSSYLVITRPDTIAITKSNITTPINAVIYVVSHLLRRIELEEPISPRLKAVFNKASFMRGGRLYSGKNGWQNLSQLDRQNITFDGKASVEADFGGMHINMLYAEEGYPAIENPYSMILGEDGKPVQKGDPMRELAKRMMLVAINAKDDEETVGVMKGYEQQLRDELKKKGWLDYKYFQMLNILSSHNSYWDGNDEFWWGLLAKIKDAHAPIQKHFCSDAGGKLMYKDSQIIMDALLALVRQGIPCLPVHDSIIAPEEHLGALCAAMDNAFFKHMGSHCPITI